MTKNYTNNLSFVTIISIGIIILCSLFNTQPWKNAEQKNSLIDWDITSYYSYLPAYFIHNDISLSFTENDTINYAEKHQFWPEKSPNGGKVIKTTMGMSILYSPFFTLAHIYSKKSKKYNANGFSKPYEFFLAISSFFYFLIGLYYLRKLLLKSFNEIITSITLISIVLGTNLYYYCTIEPCMSHAYNFSLISMFIYFSIQWYNKPKIKYSILVGLIGGLITLIRPINIIIFLFPLLYRYNNINEKIKMFWKQWNHLLLIGLLSFIVVLPQLIYWKQITGQWVFHSYVGERFFFEKPHVLEFLFSYRSGWLLYTPIMLFAIFGCFSKNKIYKDYYYPLIILFFINLYILSSWWCWWYGGSFGMRTMIDIYGILAIPFATTILWVSKQKNTIKYPIVTLIVLFIYLNIFQTFQKSNHVIHWDSMTKKAYWSNFHKLHLKTEDEWEVFKTQIQTPDYEKAKKGIDDYKFNPF